MESFIFVMLMLSAFWQQIAAFPTILQPGTRCSTPFDAAAQLVSVSGKHAFKAPGHDDLRGPCPVLNAMANHNYLPHNGVATIAEFVEAQKTCFNVGDDLALTLTLFGALLSGNLQDWSIGGPPPPSLLDPGLLVQQYGLSFSHNKYEGDGSPTRGDLYQYGNDYKLVLDQFIALYAMQPEQGADFTVDIITKFRALRLQESISKNPYYFAAPLPQIGAVTGGYLFIPRAMANHSDTQPDGYLDKDVLKSFFAITGDSPDVFKYTEGYERIPNNWYKRSGSMPYGLELFFGDAIAMLSQHPEFVKIGGNTGSTNSFTGVDLSSLTKGAYRNEDLMNPKKVMCFTYQFAFLALPDTLQSLTGNLAAVLTQVIDKLKVNLTPYFQSWGCPELAAVDEGEFAKFPGFKNLKADGTYPGIKA